MDEDIARIPLRNVKSEIVAWALVDAVDEARVLDAGPWHRRYDGYAVHTLWASGRSLKVRMHRFILGMGTKADDPREVDHINRDPLDNRRANLRPTDRFGNNQNQSKSGHRDGSSQYRGVSWLGAARKWQVQVWVNGAQHYLGLFVDEAEAGRVAAAFRLRHMPGAVE